MQIEPIEKVRGHVDMSFVLWRRALVLLLYGILQVMEWI